MLCCSSFTHIAPGDEKWPEEELLSARSPALDCNVEENLRDQVLEVEVRGGKSRAGEALSVEERCVSEGLGDVSKVTELSGGRGDRQCGNESSRVEFPFL